MNFNQARYYLLHILTARQKGYGIHSPFAYRLCEDVFYNKDSFYDFETLDLLRENLLNDPQILNIEDHGAGSKTFKGSRRLVKDIAAKGISSKRQSEILYMLVNYMSCRNILELGTSLGLTTQYLAKANTKAQVISIEGSPELYNFARSFASKTKTTNIEFVQARFDDVLETILMKLPSLDLFYVDGNHTYEATIRYFKTALPKSHNNSVFVFDDIYWSEGMTRAWREIREHPQVRLTIDFYYFGIVFFKEELKEKRNLRLRLL